MKNEILKKYNDLYDEIVNNYNRVKVIDNYDYEEYTTFYINKNESFEKFQDLWEQFLEKEEENENDLSYDEKITKFVKKTQGKVDFFELGTLCVFTNNDYELYI